MNGFMHIYCWTMLSGVSFMCMIFVDRVVQVCV